MSVIIENEYQGEGLDKIDYEKLIVDVVNEVIDYVMCPFECEVNVTITDNQEIHRINKEFRDVDKPTDVLSFPMIEYEKEACFDTVEDNIDNFNPDTGEMILGDIIVSFDKVKSQANEFNHSIKREFAFLVAHSMLHLFGFDHMEDNERIVMENKQREILEKMGITRE